MTVRNVTLSGILIDAEKKPISNVPIAIHTITDLFKTSFLADTTTQQDGQYRVEFPLTGVKMAIVITSNTPELKKFMLVSESSPQVNIPSPKSRQKMQRLTPERLSSKNKSSSFDILAKRSLGPHWQEEVLKKIPSITTESIQTSYRPNPIPLTADEEIAFLKNSLYFSLPEIDEKRRTWLYQVPAFDPQHPEVRITLLEHFKPSIQSVSLKYPNEEWLVARPDDPQFTRFLYLANSAALVEGLTSKLLTWTHVLPSRYAQAFLSVISPKNPLKKLLGNFLNDAYLIDHHLGMPTESPLLDLIASMGIEKNFIDQQLIKGLGLKLRTHLQPISSQEYKLTREGSSHRRQCNLLRQIETFRTRVLSPVLDEFFDWYRNELTDLYFTENEKLLITFQHLEDQSINPEALEEKPLNDPTVADKKNIVKKLKEWCEEALLLTTLYPFILSRSLEYLTDLRFASLRPENRALNEGNTFDPFGGTTPENAAKQLSRIQLIIKKKHNHVSSMTGHYSRLNHYLESEKEALMSVGIEIDKLTI